MTGEENIGSLVLNVHFTVGSSLKSGNLPDRPGGIFCVTDLLLRMNNNKNNNVVLIKLCFDIVMIICPSMIKVWEKIQVSEFSLCFASSPHFPLHLKASKNWSRWTLIFHNIPLAARAGHFSTQILHLPQLLLSTGTVFIPGSRSRSIVTSLSLGPNFFEISRSVLPIHPRPALAGPPGRSPFGRGAYGLFGPC